MGLFAKARTTYADVEAELYPLWGDMVMSVEQLFAGIRERRTQSAKVGLRITKTVEPFPTHAELMDRVNELPEFQAVIRWVRERIFIKADVFRSVILKCLAAEDVVRATKLRNAAIPRTYNGPAHVRMYATLGFVIVAAVLAIGYAAFFREAPGIDETVPTSTLEE